VNPQLYVRLLQMPLILAALVPCWGCGPGLRSNGTNGANGDTHAAAPLAVRAAPVRTEEWVVAVPVSGDLRSRFVVEIRAEVGGKLAAVSFEEGDFIRKGQLIAEIDPVNYQLAYDQAHAAVQVADAGIERIRVVLDHARRERERADNLLRSGGITEKDHQAAVTSVREAETQLRLAEAQAGQARAVLAIAEKSLRDCRILAPADGRIQEKFLNEGSLITAGSPLCTLVDNTRLELECNVPSYRLAEIRPGQTAVFTTPTWGDRRFEGTVQSINPMVEAESRAAKVNVRISNPREELRSGMFARGEIELRRVAEALVIPRSAFVAEQSGAAFGSVYVVEGGHAGRRQVEVVDGRRDLLWIRDGIKEGDLVIVEIGPALQDGSAVQIEAAQPKEG